MKLLRRRKTILIILIAIWLGGMVYFLAPLTGTKDGSRQSLEVDDNFIPGDTNDLEALEREANIQNGNTNEDTNNENVSEMRGS